MVFIKNLKINLKNTREKILNNINKLFNKNIDKNFLEKLNIKLIESDLGIKTSEKIINILKKRIKNDKLFNKENIIKELSNILIELIKPYEEKLTIQTTIKPFVILVVGINGSGKTTTIGKLANLFCNNKSIVVAAGDTFRKGSIEQLEKSINNKNIDIIKQHYNADSASVIFDSLKFTINKKKDILIADTSGRLHTNEFLLKELLKIKNVLKKIDNTAPHEIMLIIDSTIGQNSIIQAIKFNDLLNITGITVTKLDGSSKAGAIIPIIEELKIPIRYICTGETNKDINIFKSEEFIKSLLDIKND